VLIDRPGQGHSRKSRRHQSDPRIQADMAAQIMDRLGIARAIVVGHSWGGAVTAAFGYQHSEKAAALVFVAPATHPWPGGIDWHYRVGAMPVIGRVFSELLAFPVGIGLVPCALRSIFSPGNPSDGYRETVGAALVLRPASFLANCQDIADLYRNVMAMQLRYPEITAPVEIVTGDSDNIVAPAIHSYGLVRDIAGAKLTVLPGVGHMPHWSEPENVLKAIARAVERSRAGGIREAAE
jgi:pimeloyl-ACP methyl ester carboxylesterase